MSVKESDKYEAISWYWTKEWTYLSHTEETDKKRHTIYLETMSLSSSVYKYYNTINSNPVKIGPLSFARNSVLMKKLYIGEIRENEPIKLEVELRVL